MIDTAKIAPYSIDTPDLLTRTLTHVARATVVLPSGERFPVDVRGGTLSWDDTRSPRVEASIECRVPTDQELLNRLDPRTGARLEVEAGYRRPDRLEDAHLIADLGLRARTVRRPEDTMTLTALSDEAIIIDDAPSSAGTITGSSTVLAIREMVRLFFPGESLTLTGLSTLTGPSINQSPMGDKWEAIADLSDRVGAQTFDDGLRNWNLAVPATVTDPAAELYVGQAGTVIDSETGLDRDDGFYNRVFLRYEWRDSGGTEYVVKATRSITSGIYAATVGNVRTLELRREIPTTQTEANAAAAALVARTVTRGRSFAVRAVSAYWLRPGMTVETKLPIGDAEQHVVSRVEFDLRAGDMRVTTRLPDNTGSIGA